jgi:hypothetical protein
LPPPLYKLLHKSVEWNWTSEAQTAHDTLKQALISAPILRFPDLSLPFILHTDAAQTGVGAILSQVDPSTSNLHPIAYASRSLTTPERNYSITEFEGLAVVWAVKKFAHYLRGAKFMVVTDHQALQFLHKTSDLRGRLARWSLTLLEYDFDLVYRPGRLNSAPDALSRNPLTSINLLFLLTAPDLHQAQQNDSFCAKILQDGPIVPYSIQSNVLFYNKTPVLPESLQPELFNLLHQHPTSGHLGIQKTFQRLRRLYWFPNMFLWIKNKVNQCHSCQESKTSRITLGHTNWLLSNPPAHPFDSIAIDSCGPFPRSELGN